MRLLRRGPPSPTLRSLGRPVVRMSEQMRVERSTQGRSVRPDAALWDDVVSSVVEILLQLVEPVDARRVLAYYSAAATAEPWRLSAPIRQRCYALLSATDGDL